MIRQLIAVFILFALTAPALPAFSQDGKPVEADPGAEASTDVVVLKFMTTDTDDAVMDYFYRTLKESINAHPRMHVVSTNDVSVNEMVLVLGCDAISVECLAQLSDFVEGDNIVFGTVQQSDGIYLISLKSFDFASGDFVSQVNDATVQGTPDEIKAGLSAIIDGFLYGNVGQLEVSANGAPDAVAYFDDQKLGALPLKLDGLPLGEHVVTLQTADGREETQVVTLHHDKVSKVHVNFATEEPVGTADNSIYIVPGWASMGVGAAGLVAGVIATVQLSSYSSNADSMVCGSALCAQRSASEANRLQANMDSAYTMSVVGYSIAALGIGLGSYFLYEGYSGSTSETIPPSEGTVDETEISFGFAPHSGGASVGMSLGF